MVRGNGFSSRESVKEESAKQQPRELKTDKFYEGVFG
jgi:hypothetical protein